MDESANQAFSLNLPIKMAGFFSIKTYNKIESFFYHVLFTGYIVKNLYSMIMKNCFIKF